MTSDEATYCGFIHHGRYYGIPIYLGWEDAKTIAWPKSQRLVPLMVLVMWIERGARALLCSTLDHRFIIGDPISCL